MENIIKKAIEGGYNHQSLKSFSHMLSVLNPLFWQALGKACGWKGDKIRMCNGCGVALRVNENPDMNGQHGGKNGCGSDIIEYEGQWLIEWHRFIDNIAEKGWDKAVEWLNDLISI